MAQAQVQLQKPSEGGTSRRIQTRLQESTTDKRALCNTEGRKATLLLHKIPPSAPWPGHRRRKYSQTVTFWRKRFCPRNQQTPFVIWKQQVESCARSFALSGSIVQSPKEQKKPEGNRRGEWSCRRTVEGNYLFQDQISRIIHWEPQIAQDCVSALVEEVAFLEGSSMGIYSDIQCGSAVNSRAVETRAAKGNWRLENRQHQSRKSLLPRSWSMSRKNLPGCWEREGNIPRRMGKDRKKKTGWFIHRWLQTKTVISFTQLFLLH